MRGLGWIGGVLAVLVGVILTVALVGGPWRSAPEVGPTPGMARAAARVPRTDAGVRVTGEVRAQTGERRQAGSPALARLEREPAGGLADEIDRQRSAMRAALLLMVAGEDAQARIR